MRWPLRYQIALPFTVLLLSTVTMVSALDAYLSARAHRERVQGQLREIAATLETGGFPLTPGVLRQTRGLSGAYFIVTTRSGRVISSSDASLASVPDEYVAQDAEALTLGDAVEVNDSRFLHAAVNLGPRYIGGPNHQLHILYPEQTWQQAWRQTVYPPLITGGIAFVLAVILSALLAASVSRRIARLRGQVEQIATGDYQALPEPQRNDEIRDLVVAVNQMAEMLADYEHRLRRDERLAALGQLRGGLAHQLRNAVTGCRMALDLHGERAGVEGKQSESLAVALRQLTLIEKHLDQFLRFSESEDGTNRFQMVNLAEVVADVVPLIRPAAEHAHVELRVDSEEAPVTLEGDRAALDQVIINLLLNAIEAVTARGTDISTHHQKAIVRVSVKSDASQSKLTVSDNGNGPSDAIRDTLFEPLVTGKSHGTGLGLAISRDIVEQHRGRLRWYREDGWTHFIAGFPKAARNANSPNASRSLEHREENASTSSNDSDPHITSSIHVEQRSL